MKIKQQIEKLINVKTISIDAHSRDSNSITLYDDDKNIVFDIHSCYVPNFLPGGGDYISLDIDIETGLILNWKEIKPTQIEEFIEDNS